MPAPRPEFHPRAILPPLVGVLFLAALSVFSAMQILGSAALATATPRPGSAVHASPTPARGGSTAGQAPSAGDGSTPGAVPVASTGAPTPVLSPGALPSAPPTVTSAAVSDRDPGGVWQVSIRYPRLVPGTTPNAASIDASIASFVTTEVEQWELGPAGVAQQPGRPNTLTGTFTTALATPRLASFRLRLVDSTTGSTPTTTVETMSYDLLTGQPVGFGDVFADSQAALAILSAASREQLKAQLGAAYDPSVADEGTSPSNANFTGWALTRAGLEITFREYQVGSYALGLPVVVVPWTALTSVLNPASPVATLATG